MYFQTAAMKLEQCREEHALFAGPLSSTNRDDLEGGNVMGIHRHRNPEPNTTLSLLAMQEPNNLMRNCPFGRCLYPSFIAFAMAP